MSLTVFANNRSIVHKASETYNTVYPDVCLTPSSNGPMPVPYSNLGHSRDTSNGPTTVKIAGAMPVTSVARYSRTSGDEPGTHGGVVSGVNRDEAQFVSYSFDVKFEGKGVGRLGDTLLHNRKNTTG